MAESALATLPNVPIVTVGKWNASTGPFNPTREWCMDAVSAFHDDPGIIAPRTWAGHRPDELRAGEPALGVFTDMRWSESDLTIYADIITLRALADAAPVLFPNRSIEAWSNFTSPATGRTYLGVIDGLALLGVEWPAVPVLEDLTRLATGDLSVLTITEADAATERVAASANTDTGARRIVASRCWTTRKDGDMPQRVAAQIEMDAVWRAFYAMCEDTPGREWWWIRADLADPLGLIVQADDALMQMDATVSGTDVTFGEPFEVVVQYAPKGSNGDAVAASVGKPLQVAAEYVNASATRPATNTGDDMDMQSLREATGLGSDVSDEDVLAAVATKFGTTGGNTPAGTDGGEGDEGEGEGESAPAPTTTVEVPEPALASALVETVDKGRLAQLEADAAAGREARTMLAATERDGELLVHAGRGAIGGKDSPAWKEWASAYDRDPVGTKKLLHTLAAGKVPVDGEVGSGFDPGSGHANVHSPEAHAARMEMFPGGSSRPAGIPTDSDTKGA